MANKILIPLNLSFLVSSNPPANRQVAVGTIEELWRGYSSVCPEDSTTTIFCGLVAVAQVDGGYSVLNHLCAKDQANETCVHRSGI